MNDKASELRLSYWGIIEEIDNLNTPWEYKPFVDEIKWWLYLVLGELLSKKPNNQSIAILKQKWKEATNKIQELLTMRWDFILKISIYPVIWSWSEIGPKDISTVYDIAANATWNPFILITEDVKDSPESQSFINYLSLWFGEFSQMDNENQRMLSFYKLLNYSRRMWSKGKFNLSIDDTDIILLLPSNYVVDFFEQAGLGIDSFPIDPSATQKAYTIICTRSWHEIPPIHW